jgi:hypothetical protein
MKNIGMCDVRCVLPSAFFFQEEKKMYLPDVFHERRFADWNYMVRGLMAAWEMAGLLGLEDCLEQRLREDESGALLECLAQSGNRYAPLLETLYAGRTSVASRNRRSGTDPPAKPSAAGPRPEPLPERDEGSPESTQTALVPLTMRASRR